MSSLPFPVRYSKEASATAGLDPEPAGLQQIGTRKRSPMASPSFRECGTAVSLPISGKRGGHSFLFPATMAGAKAVAPAGQAVMFEEPQ
jgi:hypothetical protein